MLINAEQLDMGVTLTSDLAIVGAGPAGIVLALELAQSGFEITLIESGQLRFSEAIQSLGDADHINPDNHAPMSECTRRQVGGTSTIWGGRCVPYDPIDFAQRPHIPYSNWPVAYQDLQPYFQRCCDYFLCGKPQFDAQDASIRSGAVLANQTDAQVITSSLERWSLPTNFAKVYLTAIKQSQRIKLVYGLTCTEVIAHPSGNQVQEIQTQTLGGKRVKIQAKKFVLSGGALNSTRLLLVSDRHHRGGIGNHSGLLGKFYMGHISGSIATICFSTPPTKAMWGLERDPDNIYVRRRFSFSQDFQQAKELSNIVAWLGVPTFADPAHENGILSTAYIALTAPILGKHITSRAIKTSLLGKTSGLYHQHLKNILLDMGKTMAFLPGFAYARYLARRKVPALFLHSASHQYPFHYHGEQVPNPSSCVSLSPQTDGLGMRRLDINLQYSQQDVENVLKAHQYWDVFLRNHNYGYLRYSTPEPEQSVWQQASDGFHQIGTTRMSDNPHTGVVDPNCQVHGIENLFILSSSVFVTSGQANSTFMIVAFGLRLADYLRKELAES